MSKVALITGGATGIGKSVAKILASRGTTVIISGRREAEGAKAVNEIQAVAQGSATVHFIKNDVSQEDQVQQLFENAVTEFGRIDMAVNNAGIFNESASLGDSDSIAFKAMLDVNVLGLYYCMKQEIRQMTRQGAGSIVNLASIAGLNGIAWTGTYAATKHAVVGLTKSGALDYATKNIRINAVAPGATRTDIIAAQLEGGGEHYNEAIISAMHPMNRLGKPEEVANAICWLLSDEAAFVTGHILNVDGGFQAK